MKHRLGVVGSRTHRALEGVESLPQIAHPSQRMLPRELHDHPVARVFVQRARERLELGRVVDDVTRDNYVQPARRPRRHPATTRPRRALALPRVPRWPGTPGACPLARRSPRSAPRVPRAEATWPHHPRRRRAPFRPRAEPRARAWWSALARDPRRPRRVSGSTQRRAPTVTRAPRPRSHRGWPGPPSPNASGRPRSRAVLPRGAVVLAQPRWRHPRGRRHAVEPDRVGDQTQHSAHGVGHVLHRCRAVG